MSEDLWRRYSETRDIAHRRDRQIRPDKRASLGPYLWTRIHGSVLGGDGKIELIETIHADDPQSDAEQRAARRAASRRSTRS